MQHKKKTVRSSQGEVTLKKYTFFAGTEFQVNLYLKRGLDHPEQDNNLIYDLALSLYYGKPYGDYHDIIPYTDRSTAFPNIQKVDRYRAANKLLAGLVAKNVPRAEETLDILEKEKLSAIMTLVGDITHTSEKYTKIQDNLSIFTREQIAKIALLSLTATPIKLSEEYEKLAVMLDKEILMSGGKLEVTSNPRAEWALIYDYLEEAKNDPAEAVRAYKHDMLQAIDELKLTPVVHARILGSVNTASDLLETACNEHLNTGHNLKEAMNQFVAKHKEITDFIKRIQVNRQHQDSFFESKRPETNVQQSSASSLLQVKHK